MTKTVEVKVSEVVDTFMTLGYKKDGNYNFVAGALESMFIRALGELPKTKRQAYVDHILTMQQKFLTNNG
jgi:hypothetical protein